MKQSKGFGKKRSDLPLDTTQSLAPYVRTLPIVVDAMLKLARVSADDRVYDLGCGDGRIVIAAAQQYGAHGLGVDLDPDRIHEAKQQARQLGVADRVRFRQQDLLSLNLAPATVVALYLLPNSHLRLRDKLRAELAPGSRIVTHSFDLGDWAPSQTGQVSDVINTYPVYLWEI